MKGQYIIWGPWIIIPNLWQLWPVIVEICCSQSVWQIGQNLLCKISHKAQTGSLLRTELLFLASVLLNKAFIWRSLLFLFHLSVCYKSRFTFWHGSPLMSLAGPLTAVQYNISALRRYPQYPWIIQPCTTAPRTLFGKCSNEKSYKTPQRSLLLKKKRKNLYSVLNKRHQRR